ncbi:MAG: DUF4932 domain-containing protein [Peptococcaceae bacterium]|nr:DUF4932 domain-containing protein [Peptococcaceae bacterium]
MVDERFELLSLVFRLAESPGYCDKFTDYQLELSSVFDSFKNHAAVVYASKLLLGYDAVFKFSVHIVKDGDTFIFMPDIDSLLEDGRWTQESAAEFLPLLNDFYKHAEFCGFFEAHVPFYNSETQSFIENTYSALDLEWFRPYANPENLRCIITPSSSRQNNSATVNHKIVYGAVCPNVSTRTLVHEYCHSFANPMALSWYADNAEFRQWCDDSVNTEAWPMYSTGDIMAREYVTRGYEVLYMVEHSKIPLPFLLAWHQGLGFSYIEDVYAMITPHVKMEADADKIRAILGVSYEMGPEQKTTLEDRNITWRCLALSEPLPYDFHPSVTYCGNMIPSQTGDVMYVDDAYLRFDIGEAKLQENKGMRLYYRISVKNKAGRCFHGRI